MSTDGRLLYAAGFGESSADACNGDFTLVDTGTNTTIARVPTGGTPIGAVFSPSGRFLYVPVRSYYGDEGHLLVVGTDTASVIASIQLDTAAYFTAVEPNGRFVFASQGRTNDVAVIDRFTNAVTKRIQAQPVQSNPNGLAVAPDGARLYVANNGSGTVSVFDVASGTVLKNVLVHAGPGAVVVSPDSRRVYVAVDGQGAELIEVIDADLNRVTSSVAAPPGAYPRALALTPDGSRLYVSACNGRILVLDTATLTFGGAIATDVPPYDYNEACGPLAIAAVVPLESPNPHTPTPTAGASCGATCELWQRCHTEEAGALREGYCDPSRDCRCVAEPLPTPPPLCSTPTPTVTPIPRPCVGDCDQDQCLTIDELLRGVAIALGERPLTDCPAMDADDNGLVTVDEIIRSVNQALRECGCV